MKKVYQYQYDNHLNQIKKLEEELSEIRKYKGEVAIYQGDNWHDNPILYQTELKEKSLMVRIREMREEIYSLKIVKERDSSMLSVDNILHPDLLKNEELTKEQRKRIQEKQNYIIKSPVNNNIFVDAISNSGMDSVLLYKIAYLICSIENKVDSEDILMINPNDNYSSIISTKLSDYITEDIVQNNIISFVSQYLNQKVKIYQSDSEIEKFKSSIQYKEMLDDFIKKYLNGGLVTEDLKIDDQIVFSKSDIYKALFNGISSMPNYDWAAMHFINKFKNDFENISKRLTEKYYNVYKDLPFDDPIRKETAQKSYEVRKILKEKGSKIIKDYFKKLNRKPTDVYAMFINNIDLIIQNKDKNIFNLQSETLKLLKKNKVSIADISALIYIQYLINGKTINKKHVILTETQNYGEFLICSLKNIFQNCGITIFRRDNISDFVLDDFEKIILDEKYECSNENEINEVIDIDIKTKKLQNN